MKDIKILQFIITKIQKCKIQSFFFQFSAFGQVLKLNKF